MSATDDLTFTSITLDGTDQSRSDTNDTWGQSLADNVWVMVGLIFATVGLLGTIGWQGVQYYRKRQIA
ncbi:MAG: hypothetical protein GY943_09035 [Chloroflexi bacterium]|nr:hypothetical protein [Chloroflexota bacterium]